MSVRPSTLRYIETVYDDDHLQTASPMRRLGGALLDGLLQVLTLWIGWLIWALIVAERGQTPGKQLLGMYMMRSGGTRAGGAFHYFFRDGVVKGVLFTLLTLVTLGIVGLLAALWCLWDKNHQCLWDKVAGTYVAHSPRGFRPLTGNEMVADLRRGRTPSGFELARTA